VIERLKLLLGISWSELLDSFVHLGDSILEDVPESTVSNYSMNSL